MTTLFISDLHLSPSQPELLQLSCQFLRSQAATIDSLYILGDIFNTWLGDDLLPAEFAPFVQTLQSLSAQGIRLYLMVGNRDFMLGQDFAHSVGATLLTEPAFVELAGKKALLLHGDSLCTDDVSYQRYRRWVRNPILQWCFLKLPVRFRQGISDKIKAKSREQKQFKTAMIMDVNQQAVETVMQQQQVDLLIHGHTHRPAIHHLMVNNEAAHRVVLGDWDQQHISYLLADDHSLYLYDHRLINGCSILRLV